MTVTVEQQTIRFLSRRLVGLAGDNGISSDAMVAAAAFGQTAPIPKSKYPRDTGDLKRCLEAYHEAPNALRHKMLPILADYLEHIAADVREKASNQDYVPASRQDA